jgi:hypothetical protein
LQTANTHGIGTIAPDGTVTAPPRRGSRNIIVTTSRASPADGEQNALGVPLANDGPKATAPWDTNSLM